MRLWTKRAAGAGALEPKRQTTSQAAGIERMSLFDIIENLLAQQITTP